MKLKTFILTFLMMSCSIVFGQELLTGEAKTESKFKQFLFNYDYGTITIGDDFSVSSTIEIPKGRKITIDLNGHKLTTNADIYIFKNFGQLTITDNSTDGKGTISSLGIYNGKPQTRTNTDDIDYTAQLTIKGGVFENISQDGGAAIYNHLGVIDIQGGEFYGEYSAITNFGLATIANAYIECLNRDNGAAAIINDFEIEYGNNVNVVGRYYTAYSETASITDGEATYLFAELKGTKYPSLQAALDACTTGDNTINLLFHNSDNATVSQKEGVNITIVGNGYKNKQFEYTGTIYVNGNSRSTGAETLTIQYVDFYTEKNTHDFISCNDGGNSVIRYAHNVTVQNCNFTAKEASTAVVALRFRQSYNINVKDSKFTNLHSAMWATGTSGIAFDNITATNCKEGGISVATSTPVSVKNSTIAGAQYGVRADGSGDYRLTVENSTLEAEVPVIVRNTTGDYNLIVENNATLTATNNGPQVVVTAKSDSDPYVVPTSDVNVTLYNNVTSTFGLTAKIDNAFYATLQDAVDNAKTGETVTLIADCAGDVTVTQAPDYAITIDGDGKTFKGTITVDGKSARYETTALTIKNVNFDATEGITYDACVRLGGVDAQRYTNNVTVENCTFTDNDYTSVAVKSYTGGDRNLVVKDCEANGMHSLLQLANVEEGLIVDNCTANTKNGLNLGSSAGAIIKNSEISVQGYAVRIGASSGGASGAITLENNKLKTNNSEGDAVIVVRGNAVTQVDLSMEKNVVSGTTHISGNTAATKIAADENYWDGKEAPVVAEGSAPIAVNSYYSDEARTNLVRNEMGSIYAFVSSDRIFGDVTTNAKESIKIEIIGKDDNVIGTSSLEDLSLATGFNKQLTWRINLGDDDSDSWAMTWNDGPSINNMPAKVKLYVDAKEGDAAVAEAEIRYTANGDGQSPVFAAKTNAEGRINSFIACTGEYNLNNAANKLVSASADGDNVAILVAGTYNLPTGKNLTITGAVDGVQFGPIAEPNMGMKNYTFNNVTFNYAADSHYQGLQYAGDMVYNNCTFNGQVFLYGESETFNGCTFNQESSGYYNVWTYSAKEVAFNECIFNSAGKSVLIYHEGATTFNDVAVTKCEFNASQTVEDKAAIEMDSSLTAGINLTIDGETTATGFDEGNASGNSLWNNKKGNNNDANNDITVVVAGETVLEPVYEAQIEYKKFRNLTDAFAAATEGQTITLLGDATPALTSQRAITKAAVIDLNDKTLTLAEDDLYFGTTTFQNGNIVVAPSVNASTAVFWMFANQTLTFDNVKLTATGVTGTYLIGINGGTGSNVNLLNGTNIIINNESQAGLSAVICDNGTGNNVIIEDSYINVNNIEGRFYLGGTSGNITVDNTDIDLNGVKEGFYLRANQTLSIEGESEVEVVLNDTNNRYGINITDYSATYTKDDLATVNATVYDPVVRVKNLTELQTALVENVDKPIFATETIVISEGTLELDLNTRRVFAADKNVIRNDGATLTIKNGTIERVGDVVGYAFNNAQGALNITGTTIKGGLYTSGTSLVAANANISHFQSSRHAIYAYNCNVTLNGGTYHNDNSGNATIMAAGSSVVTIKDGTFSIKDGRQELGWTSCLTDTQNTASIIVEGGTFNGGFRVQTGTTMTIEGGSFNDCYGSSYNIYGTAVVKGGTFTDANAINFAKGNLAEGYVASDNGNGTFTVLKGVAKIGDTYYATLQAAIDAAEDVTTTINILADITGDVTILQQEGINIVIDGKKNDTENYTFNGTINIYGNARHTGEETLTIQNVNFYTEDNARYFIEANEIGQIPGTNNFKQYAHNVTVENCNFATSAENTNNEVVGMRFRQAYNVSAVNCTSDGIFSIMWTTAVVGLTLNGVEATNCEEGITIGGASKEVEIIGTTINSETYAIRAEGAGSDFIIENSTLVAKVPVVVRNVNEDSKPSFTFKGTNTITESNPTSYWFVAGAGAAYQGNENEQLPETAGQVSVTLNDTGLDREGIYGNYGVSKIGNAVYNTFADALNAVQDGQTITVLNVEGSEINKEIEFTKDIEFTITGTAPNYALPIVTFQNAIVNISNAEILIPELDARQNATINVINSTIVDAGGNSIVKSYYNGAINIDETSTVYAMQVTTMGYITVAGTLNATWQTNVYGNGLITLNEGATFNTAALHLTGQAYSGRDNTDAGRVGQPAEIVVDGANLTIGKVLSAGGADYSYNSSKGINVGTVEGKSAILNIMNGGNVNIHMANGETANIGAGGTVNVAGGTVNVAASTLNTICRSAEGTVTLANNGTVNVTGNASMNVTTTADSNPINFTDVTIANANIGGAVNAFGTNNFTGTTNIEGILSVGYYGSPAEQVVVNITGNFNGGNVLIGSSNDNVLNVGNAVGEKSTAYFGQIGAFGDVNIVNSDVTYHYAFVRNEFNVTNSTMEIKEGGVNTYFSGNAKVVLDNTTWNLPGYANIGSYGGYGYGNADVTLKNTSVMRGTKLGIEVSGDYEVKVTIEDNSRLEATELTNQGSIVLADVQAKVTSNEFDNVPTTSVAYHKVNYVEGSYVVVAKDYVAQIYDVNNNTNDDRRYETLAEAATAAQDGETIQLLWNEGDAAISMAATFVGDKTVTITGTADVDWDKDWLYVGRNGEGNGKLIFKEANLTSKSVGVNGNGIGLNVSCKKVKEGEYTTNDGEVEIINSNIQLDYLIGKGNIKLDNSTLNVYEGFAVGARPASETGGVQRTVTMDITNGSNVIVKNHNGQGLGYESMGIMNIDATSSFETTQAFLITADGTMNVNGGNVKVAGTLTNNGTMDVAAESNVEVTGNLNVNGTLKSAGNITANIVKAETATIQLTGGIYTTEPQDGWCAESYGAFPYDENSWVVREISGEQTIALQAGWNWVSSYITKFEGEDGLDMLQNSLGTNGIQIKNDKLSSAYNNNEWGGRLNEVSVNEMYKVKVNATFDISFEGSFVNYDEKEIILYQGWNYIGYPVNVETNLADALVIFDEYEEAIEANANDVIKSQHGTAYCLGTNWVFSNQFNLVPGEGYMYYNSSDEVKVLRYTTKEATTTSETNTRSSNHWTVDATQYPSNMTMIAMTDVEGGNYEVAAFVNGEVRGSSRPIYVEELDAYILILTISGDDVEEMTFKCYDLTTGEEVEFSNRINYSNDAIVGSADEPYMLTRGTTGIGEAAMSNVNIYPNPTTTGTEINLEATCDKVEVFNALGVKVVEYQNVDSIDALETAGIYVIRITNNGNVQNCRLVVK